MALYLGMVEVVARLGKDIVQIVPPLLEDAACVLDRLRVGDRVV